MTAYCLAPTLITNGKRAVNDLNNRTIWPNTEYRTLDCSVVLLSTAHIKLPEAISAML